MMSSNPSDSEAKQEGKLPRREWFLFPIISLAAVLLVALCVELIARRLYPVSQVGFDQCFVRDDPSGDAPVIPNGNCTERIVESEFPIEYRFNAHGDRAGMELRPKQAGIYRVVMIGSSMAAGLFVPRKMTFAALLPAALSRRTGHRVDLYNAATGGKFRGGPFPSNRSVSQLKDVLSAQPDMILWVITPMDLENAGREGEEPPVQGVVGDADAADGSRAQPRNVWERLANAMVGGHLGEKLSDRIKQTRTAMVLNHWLISHESQDQYVNSYLENQDDAGFLRLRLSDQWAHNMDAFRLYSAKFVNQANMAGVPLVAVLIPNRAQAAMISRGAWPDGYDPYKLGEELRSMIEGQGGVYVDLLPDFRRIPDPQRHYFAVDGHLDVEGHAMIARMLEEKLASGKIPELRAISEPRPSFAQGR
jgi:hypothetical protein